MKAHEFQAAGYTALLFLIIHHTASDSDPPRAIVTLTLIGMDVDPIIHQLPYVISFPLHKQLIQHQDMHKFV